MLQLKFPHLLTGGGAMYARSGAEALERAQNEVFDVILLDMHMPAPHGPDGLYCAQSIRDGLPGTAGQANRLAHLVAVTTEAESGHRETYRPLLDGLIPKPVRLGHLQLFLEAVQEEAEWSHPYAPRLGRPGCSCSGHMEADAIPLPPSPSDERIFFDASADPRDDPQLFHSQLHAQTVNSLASLASGMPPTPTLENAPERLTIAAVDGNLLRGAASPVPSLMDDADDTLSAEEEE